MVSDRFLGGYQRDTPGGGAAPGGTQPTSSSEHLNHRRVRIALAAARSPGDQLDVDPHLTLRRWLAADRGEEQAGAGLADRGSVVRDRRQRGLEQRREVKVVERREREVPRYREVGAPAATRAPSASSPLAVISASAGGPRRAALRVCKPLAIVHSHSRSARERPQACCGSWPPRKPRRRSAPLVRSLGPPRYPIRCDHGRRCGRPAAPCLARSPAPRCPRRARAPAHR